MIGYRASYALILAMSLMFLACGDDGEGNEDTLFTGLSGLIIIVVAGYFLYRWWAKRNAGGS